MEVLYRIAAGVKYRRESFGAVVLTGHSKETLFFNHAAAVAIEQFREGSTLEKASSQINRICGNPPGQHDALFRLLTQRGVITAAETAEQEVSAKLFFTDVLDFADDRLHAPLGVEIELTLKCMRRCTYCAYDSSPSIDTSSDLDRSSLKRLLNELNRLGVFYVRFTGGDPLTREDAIEIVADAGELGIGTAIASDLTALNEQHIHKLSRLKHFMGLQTTLDGPTPEIADEFRGGGNFRRTTSGIALLREAGIPVIVGMIATQRNYNRVYETADLLSRWGVSFCVSPLYNAGRGRTQEALIPTDTQLATAYEQFASAVEAGLVRPADPGWRGLAESMPRNARHALWAGQPWLVRSPDRLMRIDPTGHCYTSIHLKNILGDSVYVGRWPSDSLLEMWQSAPLLQQLRRARRRSPYYGDVIDIRTFDQGKDTHHAIQ